MLRVRRPASLAVLRHPLANERGVALPLALFCLVALSLLLSSALLSSSTEVALSTAHQDGTRALYRSELALERFVAERAAATRAPQLTSGLYTREVAPGVMMRVTAAELGRVRTLLGSDLLSRRETFSLVADPENGRGRSTGALLTVVREVNIPGSNLNAAVMAGEETVMLPGSSFTLSGADTSSCGGQVTPGLSLALGTSTNNVRLDNVVGGIRQDSISRVEYGRFALNGRSPEDVAEVAEIKWGTLAGARPMAGTTFNASGANTIASGLNWGCPIGASLNCLLDPDTSYLPVVAVKPPSGQSAKLQGMGQGFLVVLGDAELNSDFFYRGVLVVTGDLIVNGGSRVHGSLLALSDAVLTNAADRDGDEDDLRINGGAEIRFDRCGIARASASLGDRLLDLMPQQFRERTFGWFEVLR